MSVIKVPEFENVITFLSRTLIGIRVFLNPLFPIFTKFEVRLIKEVRKYILDEYIDIFDSHISCINYIQRDGGSRLIRMYKWIPISSYDWKRIKYFYPTEGIVRLIRFSLNFKTENIICHGYFVAIDGVLCNISFGENIVFYENRDDFEVKVRSGTIIRKPVSRKP